MKKIIVPMDFTEVAMNAFRFANALFPEDELCIVHSYSGTVSTREPIYLQPGKTKDMILREELEKQILVELDVPKLPNRISIYTVDGEVVPSIRQFVNDNNIDEMVIGTRDKYDLFDRWIGTFSLGLVKTLTIPTYLIPRYAKYELFEKIMVASDYHLKEETFVRQISDWNKAHDAYIKFLNVDSGKGESFEDEAETIVNTLFDYEDATFSFEIDTIQSSSVTDSLLANAYNFGADLLVTIPDNQTFLGSLLFRSISKELILKSNIPLLFLYPEKKMDDSNKSVKAEKVETLSNPA